jgi:peptide/nickel transport system ATP-binding protein
MSNSDCHLLVIENLKTYFQTEGLIAKAVDGVNLTLCARETLGIVGESGCGKSVTALSILRLVPHPGKIVGGKIFLEGLDLMELSEAEMRKIRGDKISMIFQEPMTSLNPVFTVGDQITETLRFHQKVARKQALERSVELLKKVGIPSPESRINDYPHQMSGGMRQRVMIAIALSCNPKLMIADEPTTALDVTIQAQILDLMQKLKEETGTSIILITHNLGLVAEYAQSVAVMYLGKIIEYADVGILFNNPLHPYTVGLLESIPRIEVKRESLKVIPGLVPSLFMLPQGCEFRDRCTYAWEKCTALKPDFVEYDNGHFVRCWKYS